MRNDIKKNVNNVPAYALEKPVWVVKLDNSNGSLWFYGAWEYSDFEKAIDIANKVNGIVLTS